MAIIPNGDATEPDRPRERLSAVGEPELVDAARDRALYEPLPSSEMFLACFAGIRPVVGADVLDPAFDLVACQREKRLAEAALMDESASLDALRTAGRTLAAARSDIMMLVTVIDEAVRERLKARRLFDPSTLASPSALAQTPSGVVVHTESVGDVAARLAELWELLSDNAADAEDPPEAVLLSELCDGYDALAAEIESGRRIPAGV
ncbi:hypothetical protein ACWEKT_34635 [Nocardia takedensis]